MINTSQAYKNALLNDQRSFIRKATIYLADGTELSITDADILQGGFKFDAATSSSGSFDIGAVVIQKFTMRINNIYDTFSIYDFYDAVIWSYAGMKFEDGSEEWFRKGVFTVKEPTSTNSVLSLTCYDNIHKFDIAYSNSTLAYPATRKQIVADICNICGVTNNTGQFDGCDEIVETRPEDTYTCRDILSFIAQICGLYGYCDNAGAFCFGWYNTTAFDDIIAGLDGGNLKDYTSGDTADGGDFTDYTSGDTVDGGDFEDDRNYHHIYSTSSSNVSTDDVTITGIKVTVVSEQSNDDEESTITAMEYFSGETGYVLSISDNPLITTDNGQDIADHLFAKIGNMTFRPMNLSALGDPSMEAGDAMVFTDRKGNSYFGYMTTLSYAIGQYATLVCDAEAPLSRKKYSETYSAATQRAIQAQQTAKKVASRYSQAVNNMSQLAMNSLGFYQTTETLSDGSIITYMHDKPALEDSQTIYKRTIDGFFISQDGGNTYTSGFDSSGNAVLNVLSVIGINFDWAYGGTLTLGGNDNVNGELLIKDADGNTIVTGNKDGLFGENFRINADGSASLKGSIEATSGTLENLTIIDGIKIVDADKNTDPLPLFSIVSTEDESGEGTYWAMVTMGEGGVFRNLNIIAKYFNVSGNFFDTGTFNHIGLKASNLELYGNQNGSSAYSKGIFLYGNTFFDSAATFNAPIISKGGNYVHTATGTSGSYGYVKIAQLEITGNYANQSLIFHIAQRTRREYSLEIRFSNVDSTDPELNIFIAYGALGIFAYLVKSDTSVWNLYISKSEAYDSICVTEFYYPEYIQNKIDILWTDEHIDALPDEYVAASHGAKEYDSGWITVSSLSNGITQYASDSVSWESTCAYRKIGNHVFVKGHITTPESWAGSGTALTIFTLPTGYRAVSRKYSINPATGKYLARIIADTDGRIILEWTLSIVDGTAKSGEITWIDIGIDFLIN